MPAEKPATKSSENRRSNKPIMEKRRRARINSCLNDLKALILEALKKDPARHSKLEKADILEMTVKHLQNLQRQQMALSTATDPNVANKFRAGFNECANEVTRFLSRMDTVDQSVQQRLMGHLANCLTGIAGSGSISQQRQQSPHPSTYHLGNGMLAGTPTSTTTKAPSSLPSTPMSILPNTIQPLNIHVPPPSGGNPNSVMAVASSPQLGRPPVENNKLSPPTALPNTRVVKGLQFVPTRLPNGDIALFLPASYAIPLNDGTPTQSSSPSTTTSMLSPLTINTCTTPSAAPNPVPATTGVGEVRKSVITPPLTPISEVGRRKEQIGETSTSLSPGLTTTLLSPLTVGNATTPTSVSFSTTPTKLSSDLTSGLRTEWTPTATTVGTPPLRELVNTEAHHADSRVSRHGYYHHHHTTSGNRYMYDNVKSHSELPACKEVKNGPWRPW